MARTDTFTKKQSIFQGMTSEQRKDFHSPEAQRKRNAERKESKQKGEVYDMTLKWKQSNNTEGISTATNDTFGNDEFNLYEEPQAGGDGGGLPDGEEGDILYHDGDGWIVLDAPTVLANNPILRHNGTAPYWEEPASCS